MKHQVLQKVCSAALGITFAITSVYPQAAAVLADETDTQNQQLTLVNIAPQAELSASSTLPADSYKLANIVDGDYTTQWVAASAYAPAYVLFTFAESTDFYKAVTVFENRDDQRAEGSKEIMKYELSYLDANGEFQVFASGQNYDENNSYTHTFEDDGKILFTTTQVKVTITELDDAGAWPSLMEVELYTAEKSTDPETVPADKTYLAQTIETAESDSIQAEVTKAIPAVQQLFAITLANAKEVNANENATQEEVDTAWNNLVIAMQNLSLTGDKTNLNALIAEVEALDEFDYTDDSWKDVETALAAAKTVQANENALQKAIDEAYDSLLAAKEALVDYTEPVVVSKTLLNNSISYALKQKEEGALDHAVAAEKEAFETALAKAQEVSADENATQEQVDAAWKNLMSAIQNLSLTGDKTDLNALIAEVEALDEFDYTDESWPAVESALAAAKKVQADDNALQADIDTVYNNLKAAKDALVVYAEPVTVSKVLLNNSISYAEKQKEEGALDSAVASEKEAFELALANAKAVSADEEATQEEVDKAWSDLVKAITHLSLTGDKDALSKLVEEAEDKNEDDYTPSTYKELAAPLAKAKEVLADEDALQEDIDAAAKDLQNALDGLKEKADTAALQQAVETAESLKEEDYTPATYAAVADPLAAAKEVLADPEAEQDSVDAAAKALNDVLGALKKAADKTALQQAVDNAEAVNADDYTDASLAGLADPLAAAKAVLADAETDQDGVDAAAKTLNEALDTLVKVADKTELDSAINAAEALNASDYTPATYAKVEQALAAAKEVQADKNIPQTDVDSAAADLNAALSALLGNADKSELQQAIETAQAVNADDYTDASLAGLADPLAAAKEVLADLEAQQDTVDAAAKALNEALTALAKVADKSELDVAVNKAEALNAEDYTSATYAKVQEALASAKEVQADKNASQDAVDAAAKALNAALNELAKTADKSALNAAIEKAEAADAKDYTDASYAKVSEALDAAKEVQADPNAAQDTVDAAAKALETALENLEAAVTLNTETYEMIIDFARSQTENGKLDQYADGEAKDAFVAELAKADDVLSNATSQAEIDEAASALNKAFMQLRFKPSASLLQELQDLLESLNTLAASLNEEDAVVVYSMRAKIQSALNSGTLDAGTASSLAIEAQNLIAEYSGKTEPAEDSKQIVSDVQDKMEVLQPDADKITPDQPESIAPEQTETEIKPAGNADSIVPETSESLKTENKAESIKTENTSDAVKTDTSANSVKSAAGSTSSSVKTGVGAAPFAALGAASLAAIRTLKRRKH